MPRHLPPAHPLAAPRLDRGAKLAGTSLVPASWWPGQAGPRHRAEARRLTAALILGLLALAGCGGPAHHAGPGGGMYKVGDPYQINGRWYYPAYDPSYDRTGTASWYGGPFDGQATAN